MAAAGILLLIVAHMADYVTFMVMVVRHGLGAELNPLVATLTEEHGLLLLTITKLCTVLLVASTFLVVGRTRPKIAAGVLAFGVFVGSFGAFSNIITI